MHRYAKYILISLVTATLTLSVSLEAGKSKFSSLIANDEVDHYELFRKIMEITKREYVEEVDEDKLFYSAFDGMLRSLDPHSGFLNPEDFKEMGVQTTGQFGGVGIEITTDKGFLKVVSPIDDTPAHRAGMQPGDYITMIDAESVRDLTINQAVQKIRGPRGSEVKLTVIREGVSEALEFILKRDTIKIASVKSKIYDDIAYLRITSFSQNTTAGIESQLKKMVSKMGDNYAGIVLDLRNNPGGLLEQAIGVSELFLDGGVVVSTKGRNRSSEEIFNAAKGDIAAGKPIVVLINHGSASASEIVAGALQDHKRAVVLGIKSFGKGSVQTLMPIGDKLGLRITTSKYYTPSGRSIQAKGIEPDIKVEQASVKMEDKEYSSEANLRGHLTDKNAKDDKASADIADLYETDYQLARGIDLIHALAVLE